MYRRARLGRARFSTLGSLGLLSLSMSVTSFLDEAHAAPCIACETDTDADGVPDLDDLDADNDGVPNAVEGTGDTDTDGVADSIDLDSDNDGLTDAREAGLADADGDGSYDAFDDAGDAAPGGNGLSNDLEAASTTPRDSDSDTIPDRIDLDSDGDGISDAIEAGLVAFDRDRDGRLNFADADHDGLADLVDPSAAAPRAPAPRDTDQDGTIDGLDLDSDADGLLDAAEGYDFGADGTSDLALGADANGDGLSDSFQGAARPADLDVDRAANYADPDDDGDGLSTSTERADAVTHASFGADVDADGHPNFLDADSDGDGVLDSTESEGTADLNVDGVPDYLQEWVNGLDGDGDGLLDYLERGVAGALLDTDADQVPDHEDPDDDGDGVPTANELDAGATRDSDGDSLADHLDPDDDEDGQRTADEIDPGAPRDTDGDGLPDHLDVDDDGDSILSQTEWVATSGDIDSDGITNALDADSDNDGVPDVREASGDRDDDGVPDYQDPPRPGLAGGSCSTAEGGGQRSGLFGWAWVAIFISAVLRRREGQKHV